MSFLSEATRATVAIRTFGFMKIPLLWACRPKVVKIDDKKCVVKIPHRRRTRNHEKGLYIAAMTVGAELASGALAIGLSVMARERNLFTKVSTRTT